MEVAKRIPLFEEALLMAHFIICIPNHLTNMGFELFAHLI